MSKSNKSGKFLFIAGFLLSISIIPIINSATIYIQSLLELDIQKKTVDLKKYITDNEETSKKAPIIGFDGSGNEDKNLFYC